MKTSCSSLAKEQIKNKDEIALYFHGALSELYQLEQWLPVLEELHRVESVIIVVRDKDVCVKLLEITTIPIAFFDAIDQLLSYYENSDFKVILYVNNGMKNFQSLIYHRSIHIHLNHGESEKSSMHSNQCKSYDYTFIVGDAAYDRYKRNLINIERANFVKIGRPQFDFIGEVPNDFDRKVILYAPTDESTHISMCYTSLERLGLQIVDTILENPEYQLIYRPHPSTGTNSQIVKDINNRIINKVNKAENGRVEQSLSALDLLSVIDLAIFDNSSLIIDFMHFDKPMFATDMFLKEYHDITHFKMLDACIKLDENNIDDLFQLTEQELKLDTKKTERNSIKEYYLGNYKQNESTQLFIQKVLDAMNERDMLLKEKGMLNTIH